MSWSVLGYLFRSLGSSDSMAQRIDWNPREWDEDEVKDRKGEGSGFSERGSGWRTMLE